MYRLDLGIVGGWLLFSCFIDYDDVAAAAAAACLS